MSQQIIMPTVGLEGRFRIEIRRNGILVKETPWFKNVITDVGFTYWYTTGSSTPYLQVGSSNQAPSVTDTALASPVGVKRGLSYTATTKASAAPWYTENTYSVVFPMNTIVGNLAEIGVYLSSALFSRTLIKDSSGNPTVISVVANEEVTVYYSIRQYEDLSDTTGSFKIGNTTYNYTSYAMVEPNYIGCTDYILKSYYGYVVTGTYAETEVPANVRQTNYHATSSYPVISSSQRNTTPEAGNEVNKITTVTFGYDANAKDTLPMKTLILRYNGNNPRRFVFDTPIPKDNKKKITFVTELSASRFTP